MSNDKLWTLKKNKLIKDKNVCFEMSCNSLNNESDEPDFVLERDTLKSATFHF